MDSERIDYKRQIKQLEKTNRVLQKKLERSEERRIGLEENNQKKESLFKRVISDLQESQDILEKRTQELSQALENLQLTQKQLVEAEKMAALGNLVAGVAHEINTPIGTSITVASTLFDETQAFVARIRQGALKRSTLNSYLETASESSQLISTNLERAGELVQSFKQVAVDRTSLEKRQFSVKHYIEEVLVSLTPQFKHSKHQIEVTGDETIFIDSYPGALAQIITNLVMNSLTHAYPSEKSGKIEFAVFKNEDRVQINYSDDGCGISQANLSKIFNPFFTTARHSGGSGLGLHLVYNLVVQQLQGAIVVESEVGRGTLFKISVPDLKENIIQN
ncbi:ATP-binding protein [Myxosarcina sp. GI1]|uniref:ATP-binding protein n=1 Tax=Myxosarcina sp. GI1 TaxID=1541065 RepID=UPI000907B146|nr:ATP-binding protein [Myxosarcina sp. GI1]